MRLHRLQWACPAERVGLLRCGSSPGQVRCLAPLGLPSLAQYDQIGDAGGVVACIDQGAQLLVMPIDELDIRADREPEAEPSLVDLLGRDAHRVDVTAAICREFRYLKSV